MGKMIDLTKEHFDTLTPIRPLSKRKNNHVVWECKCKLCGNLFTATSDSIKRGSKKSCGCLAKQVAKKMGQSKAKNLLDYNFDFLEPLKPTKKRQCGKIIWQCRCKICNSIFESNASDILSGKVQSCGCLKSKKEKKIKDILNKHSIKYFSEKTFDDCRFNDTHALARFDFYLPDYNILIEYDGIQHFESKGGWNTEAQLEKTKTHDIFKTNWAKTHNIILKRFSYKDYNILTLDNILGGEPN